MKRFVAALALLAGPLHAVAHAETADRTIQWDPGHPTTSALPGEPRVRGRTRGADGVYGRFDGVLDVGLHAGAEVGEDGAAAAARASAHYFSMAGIYATYADALGQGSAGSARTLGFGVDLRPAFVPRWSSDMQGASGLVDLTVDSISLSLGGYFREPSGQAFGERRGLELSLGFGVPLLATAAGPWLGARGTLRWDDPGGSQAEPARAAALVTLGWHWLVGG
jgi:hypothetical protein